MKNRVFIIHGWGGSPKGDWIPWVVNQLSNSGYTVNAPLMPDTDVPKINAWVNQLAEVVGEVKPTDIFIGHSIGCQTILRYLEKLPSGKKVCQVILVAPWLKLTNLENDEMWQIAEPWLKTEINFSQVVDKSVSFVAIFSDNDNWVPIDTNLRLFQKKLSPKTVVVKNKGHFTADEGILELPEVLDALSTE